MTAYLGLDLALGALVLDGSADLLEGLHVGARHGDADLVTIRSLGSLALGFNCDISHFSVKISVSFLS